MADSRPIESISTKSRDVRQHFLHLESLLEDRQHDKSTGLSPVAITDALGRFSLWAGNMGAIRGPTTRLSLDYRLSEAAEIREQIKRQLDEIIEAIGDLTRITLETSPNRVTTLQPDDDVGTALQGDGFEGVVAKDCPLDEFHMIVNVISECINSLFRIGILIRRATPRDRFKRALEAPSAVFPDGFEIEHVRQKHRKIGDDWLLKRLGSAMAKRRQFISYCRDHQARLGTEEKLESNDGTAAELLSSKATTFDPQHNLLLSPQADPDELVDNDMVSLSTASTTLDSLSVLKLPQLSSLSKDQQPFECPICFTLQSFKREKTWRLHAFHDLKAYVCTLGPTGCESELFGDRDSWFEHEVNNHRAGYSCALCHQSPFSPETLRAHIFATHGHFSNHQLELLRDASRKPPTHFRASDCPFCNDWQDALRSRINPKGKGPARRQSSEDILVSPGRFKRHVATHQEQLAIFAIPAATEEEDAAATASDLGSVATGEDVGDESDADVEEDVDRVMHRRRIPNGAIKTPSDASNDDDKSPSQASAIPEGTLDIRSPEISLTASEVDTDEDDLQIPQVVRKKSGELVRPSLRPSSSRRPSSMPGTPTFSKAIAGAGSQEPRWACPFYKSNPIRHEVCVGYSMRRVVDVRQHIRRKHPREAKGRINEIYSKDGRSKTNESQWYDLWSILFPGQALPATPYHTEALEHARHFLQVDRPLEVGAGSPPADQSRNDDTDYPFTEDNQPSTTIKNKNKHEEPGQDSNPPSETQYGDIAERGLPFDRSIQDYFEHLSTPESLKLKATKPSSNFTSENPSIRLSAPSGQAFANRYDFGASLSAAIQNAKDQLSDKPDDLYMKTSRKATPTSEDLSKPTDIHGTASAKSQAQPGPPVKNSPTISSPSYQELVDKYCFVDSKESGPSNFDRGKNVPQSEPEGDHT